MVANGMEAPHCSRNIVTTPAVALPGHLCNNWSYERKDE